MLYQGLVPESGTGTESFTVFHCNVCGNEGGEKLDALRVAACR